MGRLIIIKEGTRVEFSDSRVQSRLRLHMKSKQKDPQTKTQAKPGQEETATAAAVGRLEFLLMIFISSHFYFHLIKK